MIVGLENSSMIKQLMYVCGSLLLLASCGNDMEEVKRLGSDVRVPVSSTRNVEMIYSDSSRLRAKVNAPQRDTYIGDDGFVEFSKGLKIEFYDTKSMLESKMIANYGISYSKTEIMEAKGNVVLESVKGDKLETEHLIWDQKSDRIYSNVFSRITSPERVIYGDGFESNQDFSKYRILKVKGIISLNE
jgi:LPS export ABC transporter protein LptC